MATFTKQDYQKELPEIAKLWESSLSNFAAGQRQKSSQEQEERIAKLQSYLKGQEAQAETQRDIGATKQLQDMAPDSASVAYGKAHVGSDPMAKMQMQQTKAQQGAVQQVNNTYNKGLPPLQKTISAAQEGLAAVNDPKNIGSLGTTRTLMLRVMGMNRYNPYEASQTMPSHLLGAVTDIFNKAGGDTNPLDESQRAVSNQFFMSALDRANEDHEQLKQNAINTYRVSPFYNPQQETALVNTIGGPVSQGIAKTRQMYQQVPATQGPQTTNKPLPSVLDKLKAKFQGMGGNPSSPTTPPNQPPSGPTPGTVQDGHKFKGGDPSKQENWEPVQ